MGTCPKLIAFIPGKLAGNDACPKGLKNILYGEVFSWKLTAHLLLRGSGTVFKGQKELPSTLEGGGMK